MPDASRLEPDRESDGTDGSTEYFRLTPRGEEDDDLPAADDNAPRMRWHELQLDHFVLPRRANLADFRGDEDASDE